jgi:prepilin-type N-terminal cleavage/methylation domain-containing protein
VGGIATAQDPSPHNIQILRSHTRRRIGGFTLIELSVVLVIIGLIIGGVLVGRDLMASAELRSQISQTEKFNIAANTFKSKYAYLPGDIKEPEATQLGFAARGLYAGQGDGNGIIQGFEWNTANSNYGTGQNGENLMFWVDLSKAELIDAKLNTAIANDIPFTSVIAPYFPKAEIGSRNYISIYTYNGKSYYYMGNITFLIMQSIQVGGGVAVWKAFKIDSKLDDGLPMSGKVMTMGTGDLSTVISNPTTYRMVGWKANNTTGVFDCTLPSAGALAPCTGATPASSTTCYDNNNVAGVTPTYSTRQNNGDGENCALSIMSQ